MTCALRVGFPKGYTEDTARTTRPAYSGSAPSSSSSCRAPSQQSVSVPAIIRLVACAACPTAATGSVLRRVLICLRCTACAACTKHSPPPQPRLVLWPAAGHRHPVAEHRWQAALYCTARWHVNPRAACDQVRNSSTAKASTSDWFEE